MSKKVKKPYSAPEKKAWRQGLLAGLRKRNTNNSKKKINHRQSDKDVRHKKWFSFLAFNDNGDVFNVDAYDSSRASALKQARSKLKRDPEVPCWGVEITDDNGNKEEYFRTVTIDENCRNGVCDNWKRYYKDEDNFYREKYGKDLSKPLPSRKSK